MNAIDAINMYNFISEMKEEARISGTDVQNIYNIDIDKMIDAEKSAKEYISKTFNIKVV